MSTNLVINNSAHNFSSHDDSLVVSQNQTKVVPTPGTDAAVLSKERAQLESGTLNASGAGINAEYSA